MNDGRKPPTDPHTWSDLALAVVLTGVAVVAYVTLPAGDVMRVALVLPLLLVVPGYTLLQALLVPAAPWGRRAVHAVVALGVTPAIVALLALATTLVGPGFYPVPVVTAITLGSLAFAVVAFMRRTGLGWPRTTKAAAGPVDA